MMEKEDKWKVVGKHVNRRWRQQLRWWRRNWDWMEAKLKLYRIDEFASEFENMGDVGCQLAQIRFFDHLHTTRLHSMTNNVNLLNED